MKIEKKLGVLDILIIAVLVVGIAFASKKVLDKRAIEESIVNKAQIEYTFETLEVEQEFIDSLELGDKIYHSIKNEYIGTLKDFTVEPYKIENRNLEAGTIEMVEVPGNYKVLMKIEAEAVMEEEEEKIVVGNEEIRVGMSIPVKSLGYATYGYVVKIEK